MKIKDKQRNAKKWKAKLNKLNASQTGQLQVSYQDSDGKKTVGYISLLDIDFDVDGKEMTFGEVLNYFDEQLKEKQKAIDKLLSWKELVNKKFKYEQENKEDF